MQRGNYLYIYTHMESDRVSERAREKWKKKENLKTNNAEYKQTNSLRLKCLLTFILKQ